MTRKHPRIIPLLTARLGILRILPCSVCGALVLGIAEGQHADWHRRNGHRRNGQTAAAVIR